VLPDSKGGEAKEIDDHGFPSKGVQQVFYDAAHPLVRVCNLVTDVNKMWIKTYDPAKKNWLMDKKWQYTWDNLNHKWTMFDNPACPFRACAVELNPTDKGEFKDIDGIDGLG